MSKERANLNELFVRGGVVNGAMSHRSKLYCVMRVDEVARRLGISRRAVHNGEGLLWIDVRKHSYVLKSSVEQWEAERKG